MWTGVRVDLGHHLLPSQAHQQEARYTKLRAGTSILFVGDDSAAGSSPTHYTTIPAP